MSELEFACYNRGNVIPVLLGDVPVPVEYSIFLTKQCYRLSEDPADEELDRMVEEIGRSLIGPW